MAAFVYDKDVVRWGLHLLDGGGAVFQNSGTSQNSNSYTYLDNATARIEMSHSRSPNNTANDALLAQALQEELSRVAELEALENEEGDRFENSSKSTVLSQDWPSTRSTSLAPSKEGSPPRRSAHESNLGSASSGSSPPPDDDLLHELSLSDESHHYDDEVKKRLDKLDSIKHIPHIPRTNGSIPEYEVASADHQRLIERLKLYDLTEQKMLGDGNCQFRALSDQLYRTADHHKFVRREVTAELKAHSDLYSGYVPMPYNEYTKKMSKSGEWGDHVTLQAAADHYGVRIMLMTSFPDTEFVEIEPKDYKSARVIFLSFWAEVHYNSIYPEGGLPPTVVKKKHWLFGF